MKPILYTKYKNYKATKDYSSFQTVTICFSPGLSITFPFSKSTKKSAINAALDQVIKMAEEAKIK